MTMSDQKTVIVTGASSGIGQAIAAHLHRSGWRVFGTMRRPDPDRDGPDALKLDLTSDRSVEAAVAEVLARAGRIDAVVNNAGTETQAQTCWAPSRRRLRRKRLICFKPTSSASTGWSAPFCPRCARAR